jgi:hypothetical protein
MFGRKPQSNYLDKIPVRNVAEFSTEGGKVTLLVPKFKSAFMRKWLIPNRRSQVFRIHLDETGSKVWLLIDGVSPVGEICNRMQESTESSASGDNTLEIRVTKFLSQLYRNRFIEFAN